MSLQKMIDRANELKEQIDSFGKFDPELLKKINYKFRLDWNYYSNHMEGGTLTKEETRSVMVGNIEVHGKPIKDVMEMNGHNEVVLQILDIGLGNNRISEKRMREIHASIMYEENSSKKKLIGNWKKESNHIINYKGEKIEFTSPRDVAAEIHDLLNNLNAELDKFHAGKSKIHPIVLASQFHVDFVSIHPFYDGNGRMARILTNLILIGCGYPPIIIKENVKENYYRILADIQVYGGDRELFEKFIITGVVDSQLLILNVLNGNEIDELDDLDKEIELFKREVKINPDNQLVKRSNSLIKDLYSEWIYDFFLLFETKHRKFDELFAENKYSRFINDSNSTPFYLNDFITSELNDPSSQYFENVEINSFAISIEHKAFKRKGLDLFSMNHELKIEFQEFKLVITSNYGSNIDILYREVPNSRKINEWVNNKTKAFLDDLKELSK